MRIDTDSVGVKGIAFERHRQREAEGYTRQRDREYMMDELAWGALAYAAPGPVVRPENYPSEDPLCWDPSYDKRAKHDRIRQLEIAGALIAAELDRIDAEIEHLTYISCDWSRGEQPTSEMIRHFYLRTTRHVRLVQTAMGVLAKERLWSLQAQRQLIRRARRHDQSKFLPEELKGYIWLTEYFRCQKVGKEFDEPVWYEMVTDEAWEHHQKANRHHPEFYEDVNDMEALDLAEMVADWWAMAVELGGTARVWARKTVGERWDFNSVLVDDIYKFIEILEEYEEDLPRSLWKG